MFDVCVTPSDAILPTVADILNLPAVLDGQPRLLVSERWTTRPVRWVHVCEQPDLAQFINAGDLVLTSGMGLQNRPEDWLPVLEVLTQRGAAGLLLELGLFFDEFPAAAVARAEELGLALGVLGRSTRFVDVTHSVHSLILSRHTQELERIASMQASFNRLSLTDPSPDEILQHAYGLLQRPVLLEDLAHRLIGFAPSGDTSPAIVTHWRERSLKLQSADDSAFDAQTGTLLISVGTRDERWGRLIVQLDREPTTSDRLIADRTADALALQRLLAADDHDFEWRARETLLDVLYEQRYLSEEDAVARCQAYGLEVEHRVFAGGCVRFARPPETRGKSPSGDAREIIAWVNRIARDCNVTTLAGPMMSHQIRLLLFAPSERALEAAMGKFAERARAATRPKKLPAPTICFGTTVTRFSDVRRSCNEAAEVVAAANGAEALPYYRMRDVGVHGLLRLLQDDSSLQSYTERQLAPLLRLPREDRDQLLEVLRAYLDQGRNKAATARHLLISRPTLYGHLNRLQRILGVELEEPRTALSLQFALHALDVLNS